MQTRRDSGEQVTVRREILANGLAGPFYSPKLKSFILQCPSSEESVQSQGSEVTRGVFVA